MHILLTNSFLATRTGSEMALRDYAGELRRRDNTVSVYAPVLTPAWRRELSDLGISATDDPEKLESRPNLIHGQHGVAFLACMRTFPECTVVQWIHDLSDPVDIAFRHPSIACHAAVDATRAERALSAGAKASQVRIIPNSVDFNRFALAPLPGKRKALAVLKRQGLEHTQQVISAACLQSGWSVTFIGSGSGHELVDLAQAYAQCDLVIASGRCALEAIAMGRSVIVCDHDRLGGLAGQDNWTRLRERNFGRHSLNEPLTVEKLVALLHEAASVDSSSFCQSVRPSLDLRLAADQVEALYRQLVRTHAPLEPLGVRARWTADLYNLASEMSRHHLDHWRRLAQKHERSMTNLSNV